jgi:hypothetical protein
MGLDMYLTGDDYVPSFGDSEREDRDGYPVASYRVAIADWRKFAPLHCYIVNTYADGRDECQEIELGIDELLDIADALETDRLPPNEECHGFFFGSNDWWAELRAAGKSHASAFREAADWCGRGDGAWRSCIYRASW